MPRQRQKYMHRRHTYKQDLGSKKALSIVHLHLDSYSPAVTSANVMHSKSHSSIIHILRLHHPINLDKLYWLH